MKRSFIEDGNFSTKKLVEGKVVEHPNSFVFSFCGLPAEVRNIIYRLVLTRLGTCQPLLHGRSFQFSSEGDFEIPIKCQEMLALPTVCREISDEALGIFYCYNHFDFDNHIEMLGFLRNIGQRRLLIRHLSSSCPPWAIQSTRSLEDWTALVHILSSCKQLRTLNLKIELNSISVGTRMHWKAFILTPEFRMLRKVRQLDRVTFEPGAGFKSGVRFDPLLNPRAEMWTAIPELLELVSDMTSTDRCNSYNTRIRGQDR